MARRGLLPCRWRPNHRPARPPRSSAAEAWAARPLKAAARCSSRAVGREPYLDSAVIADCVDAAPLRFAVSGYRNIANRRDPAEARPLCGLSADLLTLPILVPRGPPWGAGGGGPANGAEARRFSIRSAVGVAPAGTMRGPLGSSGARGSDGTKSFDTRRANRAPGRGSPADRGLGPIPTFFGGAGSAMRSLFYEGVGRLDRFARARPDDVRP